MDLGSINEDSGPWRYGMCGRGRTGRARGLPGYIDVLARHVFCLGQCQEENDRDINRYQ